MARYPSMTPVSAPRLLKATYLGEREVLLEETRGTALFYLPGPIIWLIIFLFLDYSAATVRYSGLPAVPYLTSAFSRAPTISAYGPGTYLLGLFVVITILVLLWLLVRYLLWIITVYAVTSHRVIIQKGIFGKEFDEIPIPQVRGVDVIQTFGQRILGYGSVRVSSEAVGYAGGRAGAEAPRKIGNEFWPGIPKPFRFQKIIEDATQNLTAPSVVMVQPPPSPPGYPPPRGM